MNKDHGYTLAELAEETGLTERTVRYYIERVLPPHHKQGRGKLARYGQDTLNCIRFIVLVGERYGFKPGQAKGVLADVPQETIDRVVRGEEELAVMTVPSGPAHVKLERTRSLPSASARMEKYMAAEEPSRETDWLSREHVDSMFKAKMSRPTAKHDVEKSISYSIAEPAEPWRMIFADEQLRIQYRGDRKLTSHQEEQIEAAAKLIELALR
jgi:DNA-binding transcriptional MerR regulator